MGAASMCNSQSQLSILAIFATLCLMIWALMASATFISTHIYMHLTAAHTGAHLRLGPLDLSHKASIF